MENRIIVVDSEPYCIWEHSIEEQNQLFLERIDTGYFEYILNAHKTAVFQDEIGKMDAIRASVALRTALNQSMEMMFSLLGALLQSPRCTYAWMIQCKNNQLYNILENINNFDNDMHHELNIKEVSWESISEVVFHQISFDDNYDNTAELFAEFWRKSAGEFCDENKTKEYNSIKHGLRINSGGFSFSIGIEKESGKPAPLEDMTTLHSSKYGSSFLKLQSCDDTRPNRSMISKEVTLSWEIENIIVQLQLIIMSIKNIVLRLKDINKCNTDEQFTRPRNAETFIDAWKQVSGVQNLESRIVTDCPQPVPTSKRDLLDTLAKSKGK